jgi:serine/threonine protein kinase
MLESGRTVAHFTIIKRLGAGGMGEVYLAEDTKLGRRVALKILHPEFFGDQERKERFYREARTAAGISHPNVMAIYDLGAVADEVTEQDLDYIVMEYIDGQSLSAHLQQAGWDIKAVLHMAEQIAAGLAAAHKVNIVHRDIKSDNVIIDADGVPKILDFGLAKPVAPYQPENKEESPDTVSQELTKAGKIVGTVSYMSPEQIQGEPVDSRSDIFSFGILLYRMATGSLPFTGETQVSILAKILESSPEPPRAKNDQVPQELERIIDKCLRKDPNDRYQDTRDLVVDLRNLRRQYDSGISIISSSITDAISKESPGGHRRWLIPTLIVIPLLIIAALLWKTFGVSDHPTGATAAVSQQDNALAILSFENKTEDDSLNWLQTGLPEILLTDLSQSQDINIVSRDRIIDYLKASRETTDSTFSHPEFTMAAQRLGASHALSGAFYRLSNNYRIDARLEDLATNRILFTEKVVGDDLFAMVDSLTDKIARSLNLDTDPTHARSVATYTSSSPEAYRKYRSGMEKFEKELFDEAIVDFKQAIEIDSTFALPYMRIGMAHVFQSRPQQGAHWFQLARKYQDRLPNWEANLLDVYADLWLDHKFDEAFIKMQMLVKNHPNDKESRVIYGLMIQGFTGDSTSAMAQYDTALQLDPQYLLALTTVSRIYERRDDHEKAVQYARQARTYHPDSPTPYLLLSALYTGHGDLQLAANEYRQLLDQFPGQAQALIRLDRVYIRLRDFDNAKKIVEQIRQYHTDDPYLMESYYDELANLANWEGKFLTGIKYRFQGLDVIKTTGDSMLIAGKYLTIANAYHFLKMPDSVIKYAKLSYDWGVLFQKANYPLLSVQVSPSSADSMRPILQGVLANMRAILPSGMFAIIDGVREMFEGDAVHDTAKVIEASLKIYNVSAEGNESSEQDAGMLSAAIGEYKQANDILEKYVTGKQMSSSGQRYPQMLYYLAVAEEGMGNTQSAIQHYREVLQFWGKPEVEVRQIKDARERLARLTS